MPKHRGRPRTAPTPRQYRRLGAALMATALVAAGSALLPAQATTTVTPAEPGANPTTPVVRDSSVTVSVDRSALSFYRSSSTANFAPVAPSAFILNTTTCRGDTGAATGNNSPRTTVTVTGPNGAEVLSMLSPVRDMGLFSPTGAGGNPPYQPAPTQPGPSSTNYRGDFPTPASGSNPYHGMKATLDLSGKPAGIYTVTTTNRNMVKTGTAGACTVGTPPSSGTGYGNTFAAGVETKVTTFEYRPWEVQFKDVFGKGSVRANISTPEFEFTVDGHTSRIYSGAPTATGERKAQQVYALNGNFALPSDPQACVADPASCIPSNATPCNAPTTGCTPRIMLLYRPTSATDTDKSILAGVFDLKTKAFIAYASVDGTTRTLMSLGTKNDAYYQSVLAKLSTAAGSQGVDLPSILATTVRVRTGQQQVSLSLLNGLQIDPSTDPGGVQIATDATVQAGVILHVYFTLRLSGGACTATSGSSETTGRYTPSEAYGYTVTKSDLLPEVPAVGPLAAITSGPLYHITGKFNPDNLANVASAVIGVDTAADEPNGYPVWVAPFLSGINVKHPKTLDFLGTATWSASETPIGSFGCLVSDTLLGTGVAVYNNPLPVGIGTVFDPLATPTPAAEQLTDAINTAVDDVVSQVAANPTVSSLLNQVTALLPLS